MTRKKLDNICWGNDETYYAAIYGEQKEYPVSKLKTILPSKNINWKLVDMYLKQRIDGI